MKDFLKKYQNQNNMSNLAIIITSLILAIGINIFLIDGTDIGNKLKTSVLDSNQNEIKADLYIEKVDNKILIKNSKDILGTKNISFSITYNPSLIEIKEVRSNLGENMILGEKNTGFETYLLNISGKDISKNTPIAEIIASKNKDESTQINMINANFIDNSDEKYNLSTSGITF
ncbi:MAG: hypothetical protein PHI37_03925 [Candidatus Gracilibacteria bacterium]|nr:hypothetical protein [Candidatus Gracilibacteria bacterium]